MALSSRRARPSRFSRTRAKRARKPSSPRSRGRDVNSAMDAWSRVLDTFFKWELIQRYLPAILDGIAVTIEIAAAVVITGILARSRAGDHAHVSHPADQHAHRDLRRHVPGAA